MHNWENRKSVLRSSQLTKLRTGFCLYTVQRTHSNRTIYLILRYILTLKKTSARKGKSPVTVSSSHHPLNIMYVSFSWRSVEAVWLLMVWYSWNRGPFCTTDTPKTKRMYCKAEGRRRNGWHMALYLEHEVSYYGNAIRHVQRRFHIGRTIINGLPMHALYCM